MKAKEICQSHKSINRKVIVLSFIKFQQNFRNSIIFCYSLDSKNCLEHNLKKKLKSIFLIYHFAETIEAANNDEESK